MSSPAVSPRRSPAPTARGRSWFLAAALLLSLPALSGCSKGDGAPFSVTYSGKVGTDFMTKDRPVFVLKNTSDRPVKAGYVTAYGYDATGKQVAIDRMNWGYELKPGDTKEVTIGGPETIAKGAKEFEVASEYVVYLDGTRWTNPVPPTNERPKGGK